MLVCSFTGWSVSESLNRKILLILTLTWRDGTAVKKDPNSHPGSLFSKFRLHPELVNLSWNLLRARCAGSNWYLLISVLYVPCQYLVLCRVAISILLHCMLYSPSFPLKTREQLLRSSVNLLPQKHKKPGSRAHAGGHLQLCWDFIAKGIENLGGGFLQEKNDRCLLNTSSEIYDWLENTQLFWSKNISCVLSFKCQDDPENWIGRLSRTWWQK